MDQINTNNNCFKPCTKCKGRGKTRQKPRKKAKLNYKRALEEFEQTKGDSKAPIRPKGHLSLCKTCLGSGLNSSTSFPPVDNVNFPHIAIIGGGIGGFALAAACLHRGIPFTLFERDSNFDSRSQGYGLTLQQASKAIHAFGISNLEQGIVSTRHVVHSTDGKIIGEWGMRKWLSENEKKSAKRTNIHIARQALRLALIKQFGGHNAIHWGHQLIDFKQVEDEKMELTFKVDGETKQFKTDLIVGADGIRSTTRKLLIGDHLTPLNYLGCIVMLGICKYNDIKNTATDLLDGKTVFQTANGNERIYIMPYSNDSIMWQLSFPMPEKKAKDLNTKGPGALKVEAQKRTQWHAPIPQIIEATQETLISGYPVYDRELLSPELLAKEKQITLIGDAAHPMSPFKGQGANQALLDALSLAREVYMKCQPLSQWRTKGIRNRVLNTFEEEMLTRSASKVKDSAEAAKFLHSAVVLHKGNEPRGKILKRKN